MLCEFLFLSLPLKDPQDQANTVNIKPLNPGQKSSAFSIYRAWALPFFWHKRFIVHFLGNFFWCVCLLWPVRLGPVGGLTFSLGRCKIYLPFFVTSQWNKAMVEDYKTNKDISVFNIFHPTGWKLFTRFISKFCPLWGARGQLFSYDTVVCNNGKDFFIQMNLKISKNLIIPVVTYPAACISVIQLKIRFPE